MRLRPLGNGVEDRAYLPPAPQARQIEVHAHDADRLVADQQLGHDRTARLEGRQLEHCAVDDADVLLHQDAHCHASRCCAC